MPQEIHGLAWHGTIGQALAAVQGIAQVLFAGGIHTGGDDQPFENIGRELDER